MYPDSAGRNNALRFVDQSVQPGDGGWGLLVDISGFRRIPHGQLFGSLSYLANPRDRNDTTSGSINRSTTPNPSTAADTAFNSVPDQFLARFGAAMPIGRTGFAGSLAWRAEGVPALRPDRRQPRLPPSRHRAVHRAGRQLREGTAVLLTAGADRLLPQPVPEPVYGQRGRCHVPEVHRPGVVRVSIRQEVDGGIRQRDLSAVEPTLRT
jgi:hypothetical protein